MSWTFLGWLLIVSSIVIPALLVFSRSDELPLDIGARLKPAKPGEAGSGAARSGLLARLRFGQGVQGAAGPLAIAAAVFVVVSVLGAATSYVRGWSQKAAGPESTMSDTISEASSDTSSPYRPDGELFDNLKVYAGSIGTENLPHREDASHKAADGKLLPDVNSMIERLAARLQATPGDLEGWRMLAWSYFHTQRYAEAAAALGKAIELDPGSAELKAAYEDAKAKAAQNGPQETGASLQTGALAKDGEGHGADGQGGEGHGGDKPGVENAGASETMSPPERDAAIRSMVDRLANRLESSPHDVEGWTRLMRSRVVLGEKAVAVTALQKALEVFKDDSAASGRITAAATELGLKAE